jgi:hypothetical protein
MIRWARVAALLVGLLTPATGSAESAWALIEPASIHEDAGLWERIQYRWTYGSGWVVNHFFASAAACRDVEQRWSSEANKIMTAHTRDLREIRRAAALVNSRCVPAEALTLFNVRPGSAFPPR